jgi:hypothetical protein
MLRDISYWYAQRVALCLRIGPLHKVLLARCHILLCSMGGVGPLYRLEDVKVNSG